MPASDDLFFEAYDREEIAYGDVPSGPLASYLQQIDCSGGRALDLGAGAGRDTIAMAKAGLSVTAVDLSPRGAERIMQRAAAAELDASVQAIVANVCEFEIDADAFDVICATTVLDHISAEDADRVWQQMVRGLRDGGVVYVEVHSTEDPGSDQSPGLESLAPVSETANAVINYFAPNQLARWATDAQAELRILSYEERLEWDYTHGPEHQHGKAILLAVKAGAFPDWYGTASAFPKRS